MRITVTGATGLIGSRVVAALKRRDDDITILSRDPEPASRKFGVQAVAWKPEQEPAPAAALAGRDAVLHFAGENIAQRWTAEAKRRIFESRQLGTKNLVAGIESASPRPPLLISASAVGIYGHTAGSTELDESSEVGDDFLAKVVREWETQAMAANKLGLRVVLLRQGVVVAPDGGALKRMLPPFKLGLGGKVGNGSQYMSWIHVDDIVGMVIAALTNDSWSGPINATAPTPVTNGEFTSALGSVLGKPTFMRVPSIGLKIGLGQMSEVVTGGQRVLPKRAGELDYHWHYSEVEPALRNVLD